MVNLSKSVNASKLRCSNLPIGTQCSQIRITLHDSMLVTMLVISCLGITILITIWSFIGHSVYKHRSKFFFHFPAKETIIIVLIIITPIHYTTL